MVLHMQRKLKKQLIGIITALVFVVGMLPAAAFAEEEVQPATEPAQVVEEPAEPASPAIDTKADATEDAKSVNKEESKTETTENKTENESESKPEASNIEVKVTISTPKENSEGEQYWIKDMTFEPEEKATLKELISSIDDETGCKFTYDGKGYVESVSGPKESQFADTILKSEKGDGGFAWYVKSGDNAPQKDFALDEYILSSGEIIEFAYMKEPVQIMAKASAPMAAPKASKDEIAFKYGNTRDKLLAEGDKSGWPYGSEFSIVGIARAGMMTDAGKDAYCSNLVKELKKKGSAQLDSKQSSDNSRTVIALTAMGVDPADIGGYNLLEPLADMSFLTKQGMNGPVWALIAFDCGGYEIPTSKNPSAQVTREGLVAYILKLQKKDGGWAYNGSTDVDMTCMVLQSLAPYYGKDAAVTKAVDTALEWLSAHQNSKGEFTTGLVSSESQSQVIVALTALGIDPAKDKRFVKNGKSAIDALLSFYVEGGGYKHVESNWKSNGLATEQGNYALTAYYRFINGQSSLYDMTGAGGGGGGDKIEIDYNKDNRKPPEKKPEGNAAPASAGGTASAGTKALGFIKASGSSSENTLKVVDMIKAVNDSKLPKDAADFTEDQIKKVTEAYSAYMELSPAEKLAVEKDESWKKYSKITEKLGKAYHYDKPSEIDLRENKEEVLPWYVKLSPEEASFSEKQESKILEILGEGSEIFYTYDIKLINTLDNSKWKPENVIEVKFRSGEGSKGLKQTVVHEGKNERLEFIEVETDRHEDTVSFKTTSFSVFALAGSAGDLKEITGAGGMNVVLWCIGAAAALAAVIGIAVARRKLR